MSAVLITMTGSKAMQASWLCMLTTRQLQTHAIDSLLAAWLCHRMQSNNVSSCHGLA
jgi:hypothetical protein